MNDRLDWQALINPPKPPRPDPGPRPIVNGNGDTGYGRAAFTAELEQLLSATEGGRNDQLNRSAFSLAQLVASGHLPDTDTQDQLRSAALHIGLGATEVDATLRSAFRAGTQQPRSVELRADHAEVDVTELVAPPVEQGSFWDQTDVLAHIREYARARMVSPWSLLGVAMLRVLAITPPTVVLPPLIGGYGSLNMFVALVGPSGVGKGATEAAAIDAIDFCEDVYTAPVGSGEGIAHQYAHRDRNGITRDRDSVLFSVPEIDTLTALGQRQGSTLLSQLRSAFSGERLGFGYADATRRLPIERHTYRLGMTVGVQPEKAGSLLRDADGGTPQRFVWLPATDPDITADPPEAPPQWVVEKQTWHVGYGMMHVLNVPEQAARMIRENHAARARGAGDALDGHALFAREKVAQALTLLDGRRQMTDADWELSGVVMAMSDATRTRMAATLEQQVKVADHSRAQREASRAVLVSETVADAAVRRVAARVLKLVHKAGEESWSSIRTRLASRDREYFEEAVERLVSAGQIEVLGEVNNRRIRAVE